MSGLPKAGSVSSLLAGIGFLRSLGDKNAGRGDMGVRGDGNGEVGTEEPFEIDFEEDEREIGLNLKRLEMLERRDDLSTTAALLTGGDWLLVIPRTNASRLNKAVMGVAGLERDLEWLRLRSRLVSLAPTAAAA